MRTSIAATALLLLIGPHVGDAHAQTQLLRGNKIVIKNPAVGGPSKRKMDVKIVADIALPAAVAEDPRCAPLGSGTASILVASQDTGESFTIDLGGAKCANWTVNARGTKYKYRDLSGTTCKSVTVLRKRSVKASCKGVQVDYDLGADQGTVDVVLSLGTSPRLYCTTFAPISSPVSCVVKKNGTDNVRFITKGCKFAPAACATP